MSERESGASKELSSISEALNAKSKGPRKDRSTITWAKDRGWGKQEQTVIGALLDESDEAGVVVPSSPEGVTIVVGQGDGLLLADIKSVS
jgi:hypothetical protein